MKYKIKCITKFHIFNYHFFWRVSKVYMGKRKWVITLQKKMINYPEVAAVLLTSGSRKPSAETFEPLQFFTQLQRAASWYSSETDWSQLNNSMITRYKVPSYSQSLNKGSKTTSATDSVSSKQAVCINALTSQSRCCWKRVIIAHVHEEVPNVHTLCFCCSFPFYKS